MSISQVNAAWAFSLGFTMQSLRTHWKHRVELHPMSAHIGVGEAALRIHRMHLSQAQPLRGTAVTSIHAPGHTRADWTL